MIKTYYNDFLNKINKIKDDLNKNVINISEFLPYFINSIENDLKFCNKLLEKYEIYYIEEIYKNIIELITWIITYDSINIDKPLKNKIVNLINKSIKNNNSKFQQQNINSFKYIFNINNNELLIQNKLYLILYIILNNYSFLLKMKNEINKSINIMLLIFQISYENLKDLCIYDCYILNLILFNYICLTEDYNENIFNSGLLKKIIIFFENYLDKIKFTFNDKNIIKICKFTNIFYYYENKFENLKIMLNSKTNYRYYKINCNIISLFYYKLSDLITKNKDYANGQKLKIIADNFIYNKIENIIQNEHTNTTNNIEINNKEYNEALLNKVEESKDSEKENLNDTIDNIHKLIYNNYIFIEDVKIKLKIYDNSNYFLIDFYNQPLGIKKKFNWYYENLINYFIENNIEIKNLNDISINKIIEYINKHIDFDKKNLLLNLNIN